MNMTIVTIAWFACIAAVAWAGAWKLGDGGGWLIFLAFMMVGATSISGGLEVK